MKFKIHLNAEEIHEKVKESNIGIDTFYKSLKLFIGLGILKEININGVSYYKVKIFSGKPLHIHFKCLKCNIDSTKLDYRIFKTK